MEMNVLNKYFEHQMDYSSKADRLEQAITAMINDGIFKNGDQLPPQREIAEETGMALSVVNKVIVRLKKQGILYGERGRGTFVAFKEQFAHDFGDRFSLDDTWLDMKERPNPHPNLILCNLVERLSFLNEQLPDEIKLSDNNAKKSLKEYGSEYLQSFGVCLMPGNITISHNAYVALWTAFQLCCPPGTTLAAPSLSFLPLFRNRLVAHNVRLIPLSSDKYGILPESLEMACRAYGLNVLTCSPECELSTTCRMTQGRREKIADIARRHDLIIIEHNWLMPSGIKPDLSPLAMLVPERTIFLEHGSKMLSCENFCSFSYVPERMRDQFIYLRNTMAGPLSLLARKMTQYWLDNGLVNRDFNKKNMEIYYRNRLVMDILYPLPVDICKYARFSWLSLNKENSSSLLRHKLAEKGILISTARNYLIGSICEHDGILIGHGYEPSREKLAFALQIIRDEVMKL